MRNRAKCALCQSIIESLHEYHVVSCNCGAITIEGGDVQFWVHANVPEAFLRIDDEGNEVKVQFKDKTDQIEHHLMPIKMTREDKIASLEAQIQAFEKEPEGRKFDSISKYDFYIAMLVIVSLFKDSSD